MQSLQKNKHLIGAMSIAMITITSVDSIRNLPAIALFGTSLIFFFLIGALFFLIPSAMAATELATGWDGGVYHWVKEAFGKKYGFLAIWFQWVENIIWYPTLLSFISGTLAYLISPELAHNKYYLISVIVVTFWGVSLINFAGIKMSARLSSLCGVLGLIFPMILIIAFGIDWLIRGESIAISLSPAAILPNLTDPTLMVSLTAVVLCFCGMEIATVHKQDVRNPAKDYPRAMFLSVVFIVITMLLGTLAIAVIVPQNQLSLVAGIMQAFDIVLKAEHFTWLAPLITISIIFGSLGGLNNWIIAPNRGLLYAMEDLNLGEKVRKTNKRGVPVKIILIQAIIVTLLSLVFLLIPSVNGSYWILTAMTAQLYMGMYILMFAAVIKLRYSQSDVVRPYKIPGGKFMVWLIAGIGLLTSIFVVGIGFAPPQNVDVGSVFHYEMIMIIGLLALSLPPFVVYALQQCKQRRNG